MKKSLKLILLVGIASSFAPMASAQSSSTEARLQALEAMVAQLKAELAAEKAQTDSDLVMLEKKAATIAAPAAKSGKSGSGFMAGGTNFKISGFIDMDAHHTIMSEGGPFGANSIARDFYIPSVTPTGDGTGESSSVTDFTAQASRIKIHADRGTGDDKITGLFEMDFLGSAQGNQRVSNSYAPRLRRAFLDYKGFRAGQEWTTFQNLSSIPESASFLALSDGMVFNRQALLRYTTGPFQIAAENGSATVTPASGAGRIEADGNSIPDLVARYNMKGDYGNISLAGIARQLRVENGAVDDETFAFGASLSGRIKVGDRDDIRFGVTAGEGLGRYIGLNALNAAAINPATNEIEAIPSIGGHVAWRHPFGETSRFNIGYSALFADNPDFLTALNPASTESVQSGYAAFLWDIAPKVTLGVEGLHGIKELENGNDGSFTRFTFSTKYGF